MLTRREMLAGMAWATVSTCAGQAGQPTWDWRVRAREVMASIRKDLWDEKTGLFFKSTHEREPEFMWGNGVMFSALVAAVRHDRAEYGPMMDRFFAAMDGYWDKKAKVRGYEPSPTKGGGHDKYYDDNQWMVITFLEAHEVTEEAKYLERAKETLAFSLSGWDETLGGGIWWHEGHKDGTKNTCSNGPAAVACLRMARRHDEKTNIEWARKLVAWTNKHLQQAGGLFADRAVAATGRRVGSPLTYNAGLMMRANLGLYRATKEEGFLAEAKRIHEACGEFVHAEIGGFKNALKFSHLLAEAELELDRTSPTAGAVRRAKDTGEFAWKSHGGSPPKELIERAALARLLWLLADSETEAGRKFWEKADRCEVRP